MKLTQTPGEGSGNEKGVLMRRRTLVLLVALPVVLMTGPFATAGHGSFSEEGHILYPDPVSLFIGGVTENLAACNPEDADYQGFDGFWIALPAGFEGHGATLTSQDPLSDVDAWFYTESSGGCAWIEDYSMADEIGPTASGEIPPTATHVIVDLVVGHDVSFTFSSP